jgi:hypothetical protein
MDLDAIQSDIASVIDSDPDTSNISDTDYALRTKYINIALGEYENAYDWQHLYSEHNVLVSTASANASIALPQDFRKPASRPWVAGKQYTITRPQDSGQYESTDNRVSFWGNPRSSYTLRVFGDSLACGASITVPYYRSAGSLATTTDIPPIPDTTFLSRRAIALWYEGHEDDRFPSAKLEAERILATLIDFENVFPEGSTDDHVKSKEERSNFRMGED